MSAAFSPGDAAALRTIGDTGDIERDLATIRSLGWLQACLPSDAAGEGWASEPGGHRHLLSALRQLGREDLAIARLFEGHANAVKLIALYAQDATKLQAFASVRNGTFLGVWGADRPDGPLEAQRAERGGFVLNGAKRFCSGLGMVDQAVVTASFEGEQRLFLVPSDDPARQDASTWDMAGMQSTRSGDYLFDDLTISSGALIGEPGDYRQEPYFEGGIWRYCAAHLGAGERIYDLMLGDLASRGRTGDPHQKDRIAQAAMEIETARLWIARAADAVEAEGADPRTAALSLLARDVTEASLKSVMNLAQSSLGMAAHARTHPIRAIERDLSLYLCQAAPDAKRQKAAQILIDGSLRPEQL